MEIMLRSIRRRLVPVLGLICLVWMVSCLRTPAMAANMLQKAEQNSTALKKGKFVTDKKGIRYRFTKTKTYAAGTWLKIDGKYYSFDKKGYVRTGFFVYKKKTYYATPLGRILNSRWKLKDGKYYYLQSDGTMAANRFVTVKGKTYRFTTKGVLVTYRMYEIRGKWYYSKKDGSLLKNGWLKTTSGKRYYFGDDGVRVAKQWVFYKGKYYYLKSTGVMAVNRKIGPYTVGEDGARIIKNQKFIFVGDSRIVGMSSAVSDANTQFIGKVSMGYSWMVSTALPKVASVLKSEPASYVVFCFGINDLGNIGSYISKYNSLISNYPHTNFFFMAVNPVDEAKGRSHGYSVTNGQITAFNSRLKASMGNRYIDTYSWLKKNGFSTNDGIHYLSDTYKKIYNYTMQKMG